MHNSHFMEGYLQVLFPSGGPRLVESALFGYKPTIQLQAKNWAAHASTWADERIPTQREHKTYIFAFQILFRLIVS